MDMQLQRMQQEMMLQEQQQAHLQHAYQSQSYGPPSVAPPDADWPLQEGDDNFKVQHSHHTMSQLSLHISTALNSNCLHRPAA